MTYQPHLEWIAQQQDAMLRLVDAWGNINSYSENTAGLAEMLGALKKEFGVLGGVMQEVPLPPLTKVNGRGIEEEVPLGQALSIIKRPEAPIRIFFGGHYDTVYPPTGHFHKVQRVDEHRLKGPGVTDMKGGLVILLKALEALEWSPFASKIGWEILLNPDEEIGSPGSAFLYEQAAKRHQWGLIFEPSFHDGALVSSRKGSTNFTLLAHGKSAHAGRDFASGRNAITALAKVILKLEGLTNLTEGVTLNIGQIEGGGAVNIVPNLALCRLNIRAVTSESMECALEELIRLIQEPLCEGISIDIFEDTRRPPKTIDSKTEQLFYQFKKCGEELGISLQWKPSGGGSDGSNLAEAGLPNLDTLGAVGGHIHTPDEYLLIDSLVERARLVALFLMRI